LAALLMTLIKLTRVSYAKLNARQKENYNFQKISAVLAEYGFVTFRLSDDWAGADFIAVHLSGSVLRVQLKSRLTFEKKYCGNELYVAFGVGDTWYLYPHDELLSQVLNVTNIGASESWEKGAYSWPRLSKQLQQILAPYCITGDTRPLPE
jgi:hypothetical protein